VSAPLLSPAEAAAFWDDRHRADDDLRSGGDKTYDRAGNEAFYVVRLAKLLAILGYETDVDAPRFLLDAGCGKGWFSRELARCGFRVDGIDASEHAVAYCRERGGGPRYFRSALAEWRTPQLYDAVCAVDVLFHLLDDPEWEASIRNLASLTRLTGRLVVSDWNAETDRSFGTYMLTRSGARYRSLLTDVGLHYDGWVPYDFRGNPAGFHVATRVA
jgi:2-polyprenyl-3-methyl-5-hydroxy-6-metoxy-1,4-benzoquinol methylase